MTELKFRIWDRRNQYWIYDHQPVLPTGYEWEEHLIECGNENYRFIYMKNPEKEEYELWPSIGSKDKKGHEIYEGDIIDFESVIGEPRQSSLFTRLSTAVVEWNGEGFILKKILSEQLETLNMEEGIIIGNVYENPELLPEE